MADFLDSIPTISSFESTYADDLVYSDAIWLTAHNAFASWQDGYMVYNQQNMNSKELFEKGVYSFMIDIHKENGELKLCHGSCGSSYFQKPSFSHQLFKDWVQTLTEVTLRTDKIITLHLECYAAAKEILDVFKELDLNKYILKSKKPNDLDLTLGYMRKSGEKLVIFSDYSGDRSTKSLTMGSLEEYENQGLFSTRNYRETEYSLEDHNDCKLRTDFRSIDPATKLTVFNHFSKISKFKEYNSINKFSNIMTRINSCFADGIMPNFLAFDFIEEGDCDNCMSTKQVVYTLNLQHTFIKTHMRSYSKDVATIKSSLPTHSHTYSTLEYLWGSTSYLVIAGLAGYFGYYIGYNKGFIAAGRIKEE